MKWDIHAKYRFPGPTFYRTKVELLEQKYPYYRVVGQGRVESRVNGVGTCYAAVDIIEYGQCGKHILRLSRHFEGKRAETRKAKAWCEFIMHYPPRYFQDRWDTSTKTLNGECREQMKLSQQENKQGGKG